MNKRIPSLDEFINESSKSVEFNDVIQNIKILNKKYINLTPADIKKEAAEIKAINPKIIDEFTKGLDAYLDIINNDKLYWNEYKEDIDDFVKIAKMVKANLK